MQMRRLLILLILLICLLVPSRGAGLAVNGEVEMPEPERLIALTFDDGPRESTTGRLLDGLRERGASATFFVVGEEAEKNPALIKRMIAEGHQVGNHTWSHVQLEKATPTVALQEIMQTDALLKELLGEGTYWLRPPYGLIGAGLEKKIQVPMVKWSVDPRDWESRNTQKVVQAVLKDAKPNSIILLHDIYPTSVNAALQIVDALQAKGYWFVTVEEMLRLNGITPEAGVLYRTGAGA
ncbi:polysaccharide deacetylase family protein [Oscillibacter sp.]|uniref:polysaccharide deacetylase family protein n=1 Tax=Oscillibacter sp. TaxID=1945593 RepID=UPI0026189470|nr:polysaccharide deacetylase family protein [Oscillibacter sp.]MDD3346757.1 polysaccharide deacetylase family protein [Oscillibacter sp.]